MGVEPKAEAWEAVPRIMQLPHELAQITAVRLKVEQNQLVRIID